MTDQNKTSDIDLAYVNQILAQLSLQVRNLFEQKNFEHAEPIIQRVLKIVPRHPIALMNLATVYLRLGKYTQAYDFFQQSKSVMGDHIDPCIYVGLTETCYFLNQPDKARQYGQAAIQLRKSQVASLSALPIPSTPPPTFNPQQPCENIISYSLFGALPRYCEVAIFNVKLAKQIYPEWTCRFYVNDSVPQDVIKRLKQYGAQIIDMTGSKLLGFFWRFLVIEDPTVKRFLIRDADSLLGYRERAAVDEWINSDQWFHLMRDFYPHTELILAGMWGGCTGVFEDISIQMSDFIAKYENNIQRELDQEYLRQCIWPTIKQSLISHDSQHYDPDAKDFPPPFQLSEHEQRPFHIGANDAAHVIKVHIQHHPAETVTWILRDENHQEICRYDVKTNYAQYFHLILPYIYVEKIRQQQWYIESFSTTTSFIASSEHKKSPPK